MRRDYQLPDSFWLVILSSFLISYAYIIIFWDAPNPNASKLELFLLIPRVVVLFLIGVLGILQAKGLKSYKNLFSILILVNLLFVVLSSVLADDNLQYKLLGPDRRIDGLIYQVGLSLLALFVYRVVQLRPKRHTSILLYSIFIAIFLQSILVFLEYFGIRIFNPLKLHLFTRNINGTFGHYGYTSTFILPGVFLGYYFLRKSNKRITPLFWLISLFIAIALGLTGSRAAYYAFLITLPFLLLIKRNVGTFVFIALVALTPFLFRENIKSRLDFQPGERSISTSKTRLAFWDIALTKIPATLDYFPILGGGSDTFLLALINDLPPEIYIEALILESGWASDRIARYEVINEEGGAVRDKALLLYFNDGEADVGNLTYFLIDRAHNFIIDKLIAYGLISTLIWIILYALPLIFAFRSDQLEQKILALCILSVAIYYQAWFPVISVEPYHVTLIAISWALWQSNKSKAAQENPKTLISS